MLDVHTLDRIRLRRVPPGQLVVANTMLLANYAAFPGVKIRIEGIENLPAKDGAIFAMNHTDRYNYWPFQYELYRRTHRFTATWVKGKYYENALIGRFMEWTNNIPTPSRGYLMVRDFVATFGRHPSDPEYAMMRGLVDEAAGIAEPTEHPVDLLPPPLFSRPRDVLGVRFDPAVAPWPVFLEGLYRRMMDRFVALNREALDVGLDLLIFPQGTRSIRLSRGHIGLAQVALHFDRPVVPIGCNGSDRAYPTSSPWARRAEITYRIGKPIEVEEMTPWKPAGDWPPFSPDAERAHQATFQSFVDHVMDRIDGLVDERYRFSEDQRSDGVRGARRFV